MLHAELPLILNELRERLSTLYASRLRRLVLFGSQARGDAQHESDIDILVVLDGPVRTGQEIARTGSIIADLSLEHDTVISCVFMSTERWANERSPLLLNIRREGIAA